MQTVEADLPPPGHQPLRGAFINNHAHIKLRAVTMDDSSYMKWQVSSPAAQLNPGQAASKSQAGCQRGQQQLHELAGWVKHLSPSNIDRKLRAMAMGPAAP